LIANISGTDQAMDKRKTALATTIFPRSIKKLGELWSIIKKMALTILMFNRVSAVVKVHVHAKYNQSEYSGS